MDITLWIELVLFVVLMVFSEFFSSSETSLFSLSKIQLEQMRRDDNPNLGLIERLLSQPRRLRSCWGTIPASIILSPGGRRYPC